MRPPLSTPGSFGRASVAVMLAACLGANTMPRDAKRTITVAGPAGEMQVRVSVDPALIDTAGEHRVKNLGMRGHLMLVLDSYVSRPQSLARCRAGSERYVRLLDLSLRAERYARLVESCRRDIVPGDPPAVWSADGRSVTVNLLSEPSVTIGIGAHGRITTI